MAVEPMEPSLFDLEKHEHLVPLFTNVHIACIEKDFTIATFIPPLDNAKVQSWWQRRASEVTAGTRDIIFMMAPNGSALAGVVMLSKPDWETGPFRAYVEKLLVSPTYRRMGVAWKLMRKLEEVAKKEGRTLLVMC